MDLKTLTEINAPSGHEQAIRRVLLDELKKDGVFGEPFLLPEESQHYYVCAKSKTRVLFIDYEHVIKRCENACSFHSQLVSNLLQMIARQTVSLYFHAAAPKRKLWHICILPRRNAKVTALPFLCPIPPWQNI